jgi:hypothetical protein
MGQGMIKSTDPTDGNGGGKYTVGRASINHNYTCTMLRRSCLYVTVLLRAGNTLITVPRPSPPHASLDMSLEAVPAVEGWEARLRKLAFVPRIGIAVSPTVTSPPPGVSSIILCKAGRVGVVLLRFRTSPAMLSTTPALTTPEIPILDLPTKTPFSRIQYQ